MSMTMYIILIVELCRLHRFTISDISKDRERTRFSPYSAVQAAEAEVKLQKWEPKIVEVSD